MEENKQDTLVVQKSEQELKSFLTKLIDSKKLPAHIKNVDEAFTIAQMGKELGFATMQAFHYIIPIQGRLSLSAKAIGALLRKGGIEFITTEDGVMIYPGDTTVKPEDSTIKPIDQRTTIKFIRAGLEEICSFTWNDAKKQGLTTKDNWIRMPKEMLYARCLAKGANRIGADFLLGLYTVEELADTFNISETQIRRNDDGSIKEIIDIDHTEINK